MTRGTRRRFVATALLLAATAGLVALFSQIGEGFFPTYRQVSRALMGGLAAVFSVVPVSACDFVLVGLVVAALVGLVATVARHRSLLTWFSHVCVVFSLLVALIVDGWALNHYAPPLSEDLRLDVEEYTTAQLYDAADYYWQQAAAFAPQVQRDPETGALVRQPFEPQAAVAGAAYASLGDRFPVFAGGSTAPVKRLSLLGDALLYWGSDGIFVPVTGEANVPANCGVATQAFNMCHEAAHRLGIAAEEEANFAAFVACTASDDPNFQYSGYYRAFWACFWALADADPARAETLLTIATPEKSLVIGDYLQLTQHYATYEGPVSDAGTAFNDTYLKAFGEESGTRSYGEWVDYLIAWHVS